MGGEHIKVALKEHNRLKGGGGGGEKTNKYIIGAENQRTQEAALF